MLFFLNFYYCQITENCSVIGSVTSFIECMTSDD